MHIDVWLLKLDGVIRVLKSPSDAYQRFAVNLDYGLITKRFKSHSKEHRFVVVTVKFSVDYDSTII